MNMRTLFGRTAGTCLMLLLAACGGGGGSDEPPAPTSFTIGGTVTGLAAGQQVSLNNNAANPTTVTANGTFTFSTAVASGGSYAVTVGTQPVGQTCTVSNGSGAGVVANVANVSVTCSASTFTIGGTVSGLAAGQQVVVNNNASNPTTITANGAFTFSTPVAFNGSYAVTVGTNPTGQTCTPSNATGSGVNQNVNTVTITCSTSVFTIGGTVSGLAAGQQVTLLNNGGNATTVTASTPGGAFTFSTPVAFGSGYSVTIGTQPTAQNCSIDANGSGSNVTINVTIVTVSCRTVYAYVANRASNTVSQYKVGVGGALSPLTTATVAAGAVPRGLAVDPKGRFAYVTNGDGSSVSQYTIGSDGALTAMTPATVPTGTSATSQPRGVTVDPTGKYVYVANFGDDNVSQFSINQLTGALTKIGDTATGVRPFFVSVHPSGLYAYVGNFWDTTISQYNIGSNGALTAMSAPNSPTVTVGTTGGQAGDNPLSVTIDPQGKFAYVTLYGAKQVLQYTLGTGASAGALTGTGTPVTLATANNNPWPMVISPSGLNAYWSNIFDDQIAQFSINTTTGALTSLGQPTVDITPNPAGPAVMAIDSTGRYAYVANSGNGSVSQFVIGAGGALTPMSTANVAAGSEPIGIALTR